MKRFTDFEKLHKELVQKKASGEALPELPEKHLIGLGVWRDREQTLTERAQALETYINDVLLTGSHEKVVQVADFLDLDFLELASFFLSRADSDEDGNVAQRVSILSRIVGALSLAVALAAGTCWIVMLALWVVARDAAMHAASAAQRLLTSLAPSSVPLPEVSLPLSSLPPPFRHLVAVSASTLRGNTTLADARHRGDHARRTCGRSLPSPRQPAHVRDARPRRRRRWRRGYRRGPGAVPAQLQAAEVITTVHARAACLRSPTALRCSTRARSRPPPLRPGAREGAAVVTARGRQRRRRGRLRARPSRPRRPATPSRSSPSPSAGAAAAAVCRRRLPRRARAEPEGRLFAREAQPVRRETRGAERTRAQRRSERCRAAAGRGEARVKLAWLAATPRAPSKWCADICRRECERTCTILPRARVFVCL